MPSLTIHILGKRVYLPKGRTFLMRHAARAATAQATPFTQATSFSIRLTDDAELRQLNREFRGVDAPTDVLSFGGEGFVDGHADPLSQRDKLRRIEPDYLGDIVISMDHCATQAGAYGHSIDDELSLIVIHGTLHLLGYDHHDEDEAADMEGREVRALARLGIADPYEGGH